MRLNRTGMALLKGDKDLKDAIAQELDIPKSTIYRWIQKESDNLTKAGVLKVIKRIHGLEDHHILDDIQARA